MVDKRPDKTLAYCAADGDKTAFTELVNRHHPVVRGLARRLSGSAADGDDIAQITFLIAWRRIDTYAAGNFRAWLCKIAYREFLRFNKKSSRYGNIQELSVPEPNEDTRTSQNQRLDLDRSIQKLSEVQRICILLCHGTGLSHAEISTVTQWPLGTVKSHIARGLATLRTELEGYSHE